MNFQEIIQALKKYYYEHDESDYHDYDLELPEDERDYDEVEVDQFAFTDNDKDIPDIGKMTEIAQEGGEGQGETWYSVKYFPDHDVYIRIDGFYSSYHGATFDNGWDECYEVRPKEKTITVYEAE
jgi:hypothetical protein